MKQILFLLLLTLSLFAIDVGETAPVISGTTIKGDQLSFENGSPKLLIFWATWCPVCKEEIPHVKELQEKFGPKGLEILAINVGVNDSEKRTRAFMKKYKMNYPVLFDTGSKITKKYGVQGTPTVMIVDSEGIVRYKSASLPKDLENHFDSL